MKFKISTLLLSIAIVCLCVAWIVNRQIVDRKFNSKVNGAVRWHYGLKLNHLVNAGPAGIADAIESDQFKLIIDLYRSPNDVREFLRHTDYGDTVESLAGDIINAMGYRSSAEFFEEFHNWKVLEIYSEFSIGGVEHIGFRQFIDTAIGVHAQTKGRKREGAKNETDTIKPESKPPE